MVVWNNPWVIVNNDELKIQTPFYPSYDGLQVSDLMDRQCKRWDVNKLLSIFIPSNVSNIVEISLSYKCEHDFCIWHFSRTSFYSMKSTQLIGPFDGELVVQGD